MKKTAALSIACAIIGFIVGRAISMDTPNSKAEFVNGLPSNCRALVQANIDGWRAGEYKAENIIASLERNCGAMGQLWDQ
jgi:hypothetical protein